MDYEQFISSVEDAVGPAAEPHTLRTLADRLSGVQTRQVVVRLASELPATPLPTGPVEHLDVDAYLPGMAKRSSPNRSTARRNAEVVFQSLLDVLGPEVFENLITERVDRNRVDRNPVDRNSAPPPLISALPLSVFFDNVAPPASVVPDTTRRFADAVMETLTERIPPAAIEDLVERLPTELQPVLRHAREVYPATGKHRRLQRLLDHVAERDGSCPALDAQHARPVLTVRPAAISEQDLSQLAIRLPKGYTVRWTNG
jgi:uncharacterized protein (DUF2267 family)